MIGTRGYPSYYGGFETAIRKLAPFLVNAGWDVTIYCRNGSTRLDDPEADARVQTRTTMGLETKSLSTLSYGLTSSVDASIRRPDVALVMNVANGFYLPLLRSRKVPSLVNVDGIEWERAKWSPQAKRVFRTGAKITAKWASSLVFDARAIESYWNENFGVGGHFIPYGGDVPPAMEVPQGLSHRGYVLVVARLVPENSVPEFFRAVPAIAEKYPVVIVGSAGYGGELDSAAAELVANHPTVSWLGHVSNDALLLSLWQHAGVYFHGHSVGGTNPALVQAMAAGAPVLARDTVYNREVLGQDGVFVSPDPQSIAKGVLQMMDDPSAREAAAESNLKRATEHYAWPDICGRYEESLRELIA
ncbi:glycosyltransferase [Mycolicibacterium litorale]|uniref:glycosyltransferase n=1 Tax=Mycolicibacterium litorale TaxID=758802 RepID=UPI003CF1A02F